MPENGRYVNRRWRVASWIPNVDSVGRPLDETERALVEEGVPKAQITLMHHLGLSEASIGTYGPKSPALNIRCASGPPPSSTRPCAPTTANSSRSATCTGPLPTSSRACARPLDPGTPVIKSILPSNPGDTATPTRSPNSCSATPDPANTATSSTRSTHTAPRSALNPALDVGNGPSDPAASPMASAATRSRPRAAPPSGEWKEIPMGAIQSRPLNTEIRDPR